MYSYNPSSQTFSAVNGYVGPTNTMLKGIAFAPFNPRAWGNPSTAGTPSASVSAPVSATRTSLPTQSVNGTAYATFSATPLSASPQATVSPPTPVDANHLLVVRLGDRVTSLTSGLAVSVAVDEVDPVGQVVVQTIALPTAAGGAGRNPCTLTGSPFVSEGQASLSQDGKVFMFGTLHSAIQALTAQCSFSQAATTCLLA